MSETVFAAVMLAALLHAGWNAAVKGGRDSFTSMAAVVIGHGLPAALALAFVPAPAPESWPWIGLSIVLHFGYQCFLLSAYRLGDLTRVYPLARGSAPLIVAAVSVTVLGTVLSGLEWTAVALISAGIVSIALVRRVPGPASSAVPAAAVPDHRVVVAALVTGLFIAAYSLIDGVGARVSGSPVGYFAWSAVGGATLFAVLTRLRRPGLIHILPRRLPATFFVGGTASFVSYALVVWAFAQAPIALVAALRETSILFALLIGAFVLRERIDLGRIASTFTMLVGVALLRLVRP